MSDAAPRSSADLRQEMAALDLDLGALDGRLTSCDVQIRGLALLARRGDAASVKQIAEAKSLKVSIATEIDFTAAARVQLNEELAAAVAREELEQRKIAAAAAEKFAAEITPMGPVLDEAIGSFVSTYRAMKAALSAANRAGHGPSEAQVQANAQQAFRTSLWQLPEFETKGPDVRKTFAQLTASWAHNAKGAATRLLAPPAAPRPALKANGANGVAPAADPKGLVPKRVDVGERFADDPANFTIKDIPRVDR
jgi:hypothetical protein